MELPQYSADTYTVEPLTSGHLFKDNIWSHTSKFICDIHESLTVCVCECDEGQMFPLLFHVYIS